MNELAEIKDDTPRSAFWDNPLAKGLLVGRKNRGVVWMPSAYEEGKKYPFRPLQIRFLHAFATGEPISSICNKLQITEDEAIRIMRRKKSRDYLAELETMDAELIARSAKQRVAYEMLEVWDGKKEKNREQMEAGKEWWARVWPRPEKVNASGSEKLEININLTQVEEALRRQETIEAELVGDGE